MQAAEVLVFPSLWWEGMPMTLIEAFACGLPSVVSDHGAMATMVDDTNGLRFTPGDADALASSVRALMADDRRRARLRVGARRAFEAHYTAGQTYDRLLQLYHDALAERHGVAASSVPA
jgi:glycosyltransferase involved in cell wall biosynthesis